MVSPANGVLSSHEPPDPRTLASLTVRDALAVPAMRRGLPQVLAGHDNLTVTSAGSTPARCRISHRC